MLILNLAYPDKSDIPFKISRFPDGQQDIVITNPFKAVLNSPSILINSRMNSFKDLELIICTNKALRNIGVTDIQLYIPYFLGARSDRKFVEGGNNYLKDIICPIVNAQNFSRVIVVDPHSDVLEACLNNYAKINNFGLVDFTFEQIQKDKSQIVLVSPDAGAYKKIFDVAKQFGVENIITATKVRDLATGNIVSTEVPDLSEHIHKDFFIIDDICDGGRTFIELAKAIRQYPISPSSKIYLIVTHGIFSAGFDELSKHIDGVFTTNSIKDIDHTLIKQQNIF